MTGPLDGIKVIDFTQFMAGPLATQLLSDLGADVVKVERPGVGDLSRQGSASPFLVHGQRVAFMALNRNKRSVALDLKKDDDLDVVRELCARADVVIENFRPGVMDRLGLGYESLRAAHPRLIYCSITGYGAEGPRSQVPGQDLLVQSITGLAMLSGRRGDPPVPIGPPVVDAGTGHLAALAIVTALYEREHSGLGQQVSASLVATSISLQSQEATLFLNSGIVPVRSRAGVSNPYFVAPYGVYATSDGYIALAHTSLPRLGQFIDKPELARHVDPVAVYESRDEIYELLASVFATESSSHWLEILEPAGFWVAPVQSYAKFLAEEAEDLICETPLPDGGVFRSIASPIRFGRSSREGHSLPPELGAHTEQVRAELGMTQRIDSTPHQKA